MKIQSIAYGLLLFTSQVWAEPVEVRNRYLSVTTGDHAEHLLSGIRDLLQDEPQLRAERTSVAPMFSKKGDRERGGVRLSWQNEGATETATWLISEQGEEGMTLVSENAGAKVVISLRKDARELGMHFTLEEGSPLRSGQVMMEWMLEVGGDFFAVPTEGVADYQILPVGPKSLQVSAVERTSDRKIAILEPWWAVADRNRATILICRINGAAGELLIHQKSAIQGSADAFSQTLTFPSGLPSDGLGLRVNLYNGLQSMNASGKSMIALLPADLAKGDILAATSREVSQGSVALYHQGQIVQEWPVKDWKPEHPITLPLQSTEGKATDPSLYHLKVTDGEAQSEEMIIYSQASS